MENKNIIIICVAVIAIAIILAAAVICFPTEEQPTPKENNTTNTSNTTTIINPVEEDSNYKKDPNIVKEEVKFNYQAGEGYYKEITYKDGNFRQYDMQTGKLIGSSFESDIDKLPVME